MTYFWQIFIYIVTIFFGNTGWAKRMVTIKITDNEKTGTRLLAHPVNLYISTHVVLGTYRAREKYYRFKIPYTFQHTITFA